MTSLILSLPLLAQATAANPAANEIHSIWDFVVKGGPVMIPIGIASLIALTIVIERSIVLRRSRVIPPRFFEDVTTRMKQANGRQTALDYCKLNGSPVAEIFAAGIRRLEEPIERLEKHVEETGQRVVLKLRSRMRALSVIASVSTMLGLLGTITGMIRAFQTVAGSAEALGRTELLAKGIYEAMITTAAGLMVAIPTLIAYHWLAARIDRLVVEMDELTVTFFEDQRIGASAVTTTAAPVARSGSVVTLATAPASAVAPSSDGAPLTAAPVGA